MDNSNVSIHLGKSSQYKSTYDPSLLVREPRASNRVGIGISDDNLPFVGNDTWNAYEISAITDHGVPVVGVLKLTYPCSSKYIVESKSLKLYLNSFNMTKFSGSSDGVLEKLADVVSKDLSDLLECDVKVYPYSLGSLSNHITSPNGEWIGAESGSYLTLENFVNISNMDINEYNENPNLLKPIDLHGTRSYNWHSALLKSNCRVTSQPDWGDVYIHITGNKTVDPKSLLTYIISFRDECHFHEEICETIYKRLLDLLTPEALYVRCLYVRRGGIDINPERASSVAVLDSVRSRLSTSKFHIKTARQ